MRGEPNVNLKAIHSTLCHQPTTVIKKTDIILNISNGQQHYNA